MSVRTVDLGEDDAGNWLTIDIRSSATRILEYDTQGGTVLSGAFFRYALMVLTRYTVGQGQQPSEIFVDVGNPQPYSLKGDAADALWALIPQFLEEAGPQGRAAGENVRTVDLGNTAAGDPVTAEVRSVSARLQRFDVPGGELQSGSVMAYSLLAMAQWSPGSLTIDPNSGSPYSLDGEDADYLWGYLPDWIEESGRSAHSGIVREL